MSVRFDTTRTTGKMLLAALLLVALAIPACMTLACIGSPMTMDGSMGGMSITDCLANAASHDGLIASDGSALITMMSLVALFGLLLTMLYSSPLVATGWVLAPSAVGPPPPLDPRGERLLV